MITVNVIELFTKAAELLNDGFLRVELTELEADDELPSCLSFDAIDEEYDSRIDYENIEDCSNLDSLHLRFNGESIAPYPLSYNDLILSSNAFHNAVENCKTCLDDKSISAEQRSEITKGLKSFQEYASKIDAFLSERLK